MSLPLSLGFGILLICYYVSAENLPSSEHVGEKEPLLIVEDPEEVNIPDNFHWPHGVVPFYIDPDSYDDIIAKRIKLAMRTIEAASCVVFKEMTEPPDNSVEYRYLTFKNPNKERECVHVTLLEKGVQPTTILGYDCMRRRDIIHSLLHALGFKDEVTHPQRDKYIRILWTNIQPKYRILFWIRVQEVPYPTMVEYDPMSIMHFHDRAYSLNGRPTIAPLIPGLIIKPSDKLSQLDIMKLRLAYGHECNKRKVGNLMETCQNALQQQDSQSSTENEEYIPEDKQLRDLPILCGPSITDMKKGGWLDETTSLSVNSNLTSYPFSCWVITDINTKMIERPETLFDLEQRINLIVPGTKWCGAGNDALNENDLGTFGDTDKCCRAHDNCPDMITGGSTSPKYGLTNSAFYSRLSCKCDDEFHECLKAVDSWVSWYVGKVYFNTLMTQCFKEEYPATCTKKKWSIFRKCVSYKYDRSGKKIYQWFDVKDY